MTKLRWKKGDGLNEWVDADAVDGRRRGRNHGWWLRREDGIEMTGDKVSLGLSLDDEGERSRLAFGG